VNRLIVSYYFATGYAVVFVNRSSDCAAGGRGHPGRPRARRQSAADAEPHDEATSSAQMLLPRRQLLVAPADMTQSGRRNIG